MTISLTVNGEPQRDPVPIPTRPLLWVLRDELRLTGTKYGCGIAQCGGLHRDARRHGAALLRHARGRAVEGAHVTTIEALDGAEAEAVQAAWTAIDVPQCGYCQSGQVVAAAALLRSNPAPTDRGHRPGDGWQPLPLRHLRADPARDPPRRPRAGGLR